MIPGEHAPTPPDETILSWIIIGLWLVCTPVSLWQLMRLPKEKSKARQKIILLLLLSSAIAVLQVIDLLGWIH